MDGHFDEMLKRLRLTPSQWQDAKSKWRGVSESLYQAFYDGEYNDHTRLIFGSYGKRTQIRPVSDIDLLFKIPKEVLDQYQDHQTNGPAALLQRVRAILRAKYVTTDKVASWGKVVLVEFPEGKHNIELLPAFELGDGKFLIPNSEGGGSWDTFDPRYEMKLVSESNQRTGITRTLIKFIKRWQRYANLSIKSFEIEFFSVAYLETNYDPAMSWSETIEGFFSWLEPQIGIDHEDRTKTATAVGRVRKAREYELDAKFDDACEEWIKIFGNKFPTYDSNRERIFELEKRYPSPVEEFIEDQFPVRINPEYRLTITPTIKANGFRDFSPFSAVLNLVNKYLPIHASLVFHVRSNIPLKVKYFWKVRNFGEDARNHKDGGEGLRGEITKDINGLGQKIESTLYTGTHYVECYAIADGVCVSKGRVFVPVREDS